MYLKNFFLDIQDIFYYDLLKKPLPKIPDVDFEQGFVGGKSGGGYWIESKDYPGLIATGETNEELRDALFDSILTYFDVPRATAKRVVDPLILKLPNGGEIRPKKTLFHYFKAKLARA